MDASTLSKVITWLTIAWVILVSYPRSSDAGPVAFTGCMTQAAGPVCASLAASGKHTKAIYVFSYCFNDFYHFSSYCNMCCCSLASPTVVWMYDWNLGSWLWRFNRCLCCKFLCTNSLDVLCELFAINAIFWAFNNYLVKFFKLIGFAHASKV